MVPVPTRIYHITHIDNLLGIVSAGGLRAKNLSAAGAARPISIAYESIQGQRAARDVTCGRRGTLHDYVPFYFCYRSPMLFALSQGNVPGCPPDQEPIIYLVSTAQAVLNAGLPLVFTDGHAIMRLTTFYDDIRDLEQVDWAVMRARMWNDIPTDNDRKRRRQAEFLVHQSVPWELITEIAVLTNRMKRRIDEILSVVEHKPVVSIRPSWYY